MTPSGKRDRLRKWMNKNYPGSWEKFVSLYDGDMPLTEYIGLAGEDVFFIVFKYDFKFWDGVDSTWCKYYNNLPKPIRRK